jgi:hypothetical protein
MLNDPINEFLHEFEFSNSSFSQRKSRAQGREKNPENPSGRSNLRLSRDLSADGEEKFIAIFKKAIFCAPGREQSGFISISYTTSAGNPPFSAPSVTSRNRREADPPLSKGSAFTATRLLQVF